MAPRLDAQLLESFVAVADELHFRRAAQRLHVSQPGLSERIARLERQLGVELFQRAGRTVALTPPGTELLSHARQLIELIDQASTRVRAVASGQLGTIRIGYVPSAGFDTVPRLLDRLRARLPSLRVLARELWSSDLLASLEAGRTDLGLVLAPKPHERLMREPIRRERLVLAVGQGHSLRTEHDIALSRLTGQRLLLVPRELAPGYVDAVRRLLAAANAAPRILEQEQPRSRDCTDLDRVARAEAVTFSCASQAVGLRDDICHVRIEEPQPELDLFAMWRHGATSPTVTAAMTVARELASERQWLRG